MPINPPVDSHRIPPSHVGELGRWFAEGVRAEIAALEKDAHSQT